MYNLENINQEFAIFCQYMNCILPKIKYFEERENYSEIASIEHPEYVSGGCKLIISTLIYQFHPKYQKSILWHEFTHIYDFENHLSLLNKKDLSYFLSSYSEAHATEIQYRYLLDLRRIQMLHGERRNVQIENSTVLLQNRMAEHLMHSLRNYEIFVLTNDIKQHVAFSTKLSYYCGLLLLQSEKHRVPHIKVAESVFPEDTQGIISDFINALLSRDVDRVITSYNTLVKQTYVNHKVGYSDDEIADIVKRAEQEIAEKKHLTSKKVGGAMLFGFVE